jgi:steroid delta-isomerase-like uncharacterized protein
MNLDEMKAMAMRLPVELSKGNLGVLDEVVAKDAVEHAVPPGMPNTVEGTRMFFTAFRAAFPDLKFHVEDTIAEGDRVVQRVTGSGTMKGDFMGMPASNKSASWSEMHIVRFQNGKVCEHWAVVDQVSMLQQLGFGPGGH